jgi:transposase
MGTSFRPYQPQQTLLLPPSLKEWLPEGHLAYFIAETVDLMDLSAFFKHYEGDGRRNQPFHSRMMVKILLYGYATGVFSSRKLARKIREDVAFRVLAAGKFPAHRTIAEFRQRHLHGVSSAVCAVGENRRRDGSGEAGNGGRGWIEGESQCQ